MSVPSTRIAALDGLRAVSILLVLFSHAWLGRFIPGGLGVTIFFFISGYIITSLMIKEYDESGRLLVSGFYGRRLFRLMPALIVYVMVSAFVLGLADKAMSVKELMAVFLYLANYYEIYAGFGEPDFMSPLAITWSLAVEEHYYLFFPAIFTFLISSWRRFLYLIVLGLLLVLGWRCWLVFGVGLDQLPHERLYKATDTRVDSILFGTALAILMCRLRSVFNRLVNPGCFLLGLALIGLTLLVRSELFRESFRYSLQGIALFLLFPYTIFGGQRLSQFLCWSPLQYIGKISYSLYLYHWLAFGIVSYWMHDAWLGAKFVVMLGLSLGMAELSYRCVERPGLALGRSLLNA